MALLGLSPRPARRLARLLVLGAATLAVAALPLTAEATTKPMTFSFAATTAKIYRPLTLDTSPKVTITRTKGQLDEVASTIEGSGRIPWPDGIRIEAATTWDSAPVVNTTSRAKYSKVVMTARFAEASYTYGGSYPGGRYVGVCVGYQIIEVGTGRVIAGTPLIGSGHIPAIPFPCAGTQKNIGDGPYDEPLPHATTTCWGSQVDPACPLTATVTYKLLAPMVSGRRYIVRVWDWTLQVLHSNTPSMPYTATVSNRLVRPVVTIR